MATLMILFNHVKDDISCLDDNATLLNRPIFLLKLQVTSHIIRVRTYTATIMMTVGSEVGR